MGVYWSWLGVSVCKPPDQTAPQSGKGHNNVEQVFD